MKDITRRGFLGVVSAALAGAAVTVLPKVKDAQSATFEVAPDGELTFNEADFGPGGPLKLTSDAQNYANVGLGNNGEVTFEPIAGNDFVHLEKLKHLSYGDVLSSDYINDMVDAINALQEG
jgi:hypothetical protein